MSKTFTKDDVASHAKEADGLWIVIDEDVYDVTKFQDEHPGKFPVSRAALPLQRVAQFVPFPVKGCARLICADHGCANRWKEKYVILRTSRYLPAEPCIDLVRAQFSSA
jgi:hypothetical protein